MINSILLYSAIVIAAGALFWFRFHIAALVTKLPMPHHRVRVERNVIIPMRDGIKLVADLYFPKTPGKYPAIITRTPYEKGEKGHLNPFLGRLFASQGYVFVIQDLRGKHQSEGDFYPFAHEEADGTDTVSWVTKQSWSDGKIGTFGSSYLGLTQWLCAPSLDNPPLKAMVPIFISQRAYDIVRGKSGVLHYADVLVWHYRNKHREKVVDDTTEWENVLHHLPVSEADERTGERIPCYKDWIAHAQLDGYWGQWRTDKKVGYIESPALIMAGWFDRFLDYGIDDYLRMRRYGSELGRKSQLIVGPWAHEPGMTFKDLKIGTNANAWRELTSIVRWFDRWIKGSNNGIDERPPIHLYILGENRWRSSMEWPLVGTDFQRYYLSGDGALSRTIPDTTTPSTYRYDPMDPCPSIGGNGIYTDTHCGPRLQTEVEARKDVLTFTTQALTQDLVVVGPVTLHLYASSSAVDTDFTGKVCDVFPDGRSVSIKGGIIRARYRESLRDITLLTPGEPVLFDIQIGAMGNRFKKGHRIRLQVSSSAFPEYSRNLNVEEDPHYAKEGVVAEQTIYHDSEYPSYLRLPVVPC